MRRCVVVQEVLTLPIKRCFLAGSAKTCCWDYVCSMQLHSLAHATTALTGARPTVPTGGFIHGIFTLLQVRSALRHNSAEAAARNAAAAHSLILAKSVEVAFIRSVGRRVNWMHAFHQSRQRCHFLLRISEKTEFKAACPFLWSRLLRHRGKGTGGGLGEKPLISLSSTPTNVQAQTHEQAHTHKLYTRARPRHPGFPAPSPARALPLPLRLVVHDRELLADECACSPAHRSFSRTPLNS